jgi:hypothetical protein
MASAVAVTFVRKASYTRVWTMKRSPLAQFWPQLRNAALMAMGTTCDSISSRQLKAPLCAGLDLRQGTCNNLLL